MNELVEDVVALFNNKHWDKVKKHSEIYTINGDISGPTVHTSDITLIFKDLDYKAIERKCDIYPIELSVEVSGVKFFSIHSIEDFLS